METIQRHTYLTEPGEGLLLMRAEEVENGLPGFVKMNARRASLHEYSGIPLEKIYISPLLSIPLPVYDFDGRRWEGTTPDLMWHPLMWLPNRLAHRYTLADSRGVERMENIREWGIRVALELTQAGLYNPVNGTWVDVLALNGIDIAHPSTFDRVQSWLSGTPDPVLDTIDLSGLIDDEQNPNWAVGITSEILPDVTAAAWHLTSLDLLQVLDEASRSGDTELLNKRVRTVATAAATYIGDATVDIGKSLASTCEDCIATMDSSLDDAYAMLTSALETVARAYQTNLDILQAPEDENTD